MSLSIGIVGLPNVGKSTLFTALTNKGGLAANYPFATIEPNVGIVPVPDDRLQALAEIDHPAKIVPATVEFVDIAGLVAGASQGEGLGNQFLANIRETDAIYELHLLTMKPMLYIANVDEDAVDAELPEIDGCTPVPISAKVEADIAELAEMDPDEAKEYMEALGLTDSGLARLIREAYHLLGLQSYFTSGETETRAWTIPVGAKAPQAAGVIHSDFERGFIKAETASFEDYVALGGEKGCRDAGKLRQEGKDYVVQDGDVMHFKFNV